MASICLICASLYCGIWQCLVLPVCDFIKQVKAPQADPYSVGMDLLLVFVVWELVIGFGCFLGSLGVFCGAAIASGVGQKGK